MKNILQKEIVLQAARGGSFTEALTLIRSLSDLSLKVDLIDDTLSELNRSKTEKSKAVKIFGETIEVARTLPNPFWKCAATRSIAAAIPPARLEKKDASDLFHSVNRLTGEIDDLKEKIKAGKELLYSMKQAGFSMGEIKEFFRKK